jgi:hypothetical protein
MLLEEVLALLFLRERVMSPVSGLSCSKEKQSDGEGLVYVINRVLAAKQAVREAKGFLENRRGLLKLNRRNTRNKSIIRGGGGMKQRFYPARNPARLKYRRDRYIL